MAYEKDLEGDTAIAAVDLTGKEYFLITFDVNNQAVLATGTGDNMVCPLIEGKAAGRPVTFIYDGLAKVVAGAAITPGQSLKSNASGQAIPATTAGDKAFGRARLPAAGAGTIITVDMDAHTI